jgi:hypothetical protein
MKRNITLAVDKSVLSRARAIAAQRGASVSALLAEKPAKIVERDSADPPPFAAPPRRKKDGGSGIPP